jgi:hypothetical protein
MKRTLWIIGLCIALFMFLFLLSMCVAGLVLKKHLNGMGWFMLVTSAYGAWHFVGRIRVTLKHGDPTADLHPDPAKE